MRRLSGFNLAALLLGFAFLYAPMLLVVIYSFNDGRLATLWSGFSLRWHREIWSDALMLDSALLSLRIAFISASLATVLGVLAATALAARRRPPLRSLLSGMIYAPMALPEVILGLALLLLFVALDLERGVWTIVLAHATFGMCFVTVVVHSRLAGYDHALTEAAVDLGASPARAFRRVTLPLIAPAVLAGFLLAFTLSLDDFVIASFVSGDGATTLPMRIFSQMRLGVSPQVNVISTLLLGAVALVLLVIAAIGAGLSTFGEGAVKQA